jgi:ABC-type multidrug transport system permease subunit
MPPLPLAHIGHWWMWILYAVPALIVFAATVHSALAQRRARRDGRPAPRYRD